MVKSAKRGSLSSALPTPGKASSDAEKRERENASPQNAERSGERFPDVGWLGPFGEEIARRVAEELRSADHILFNKGTASADAFRPPFWSYERRDDPTPPPETVDDEQPLGATGGRPLEVAATTQSAPRPTRGARQVWWLGAVACGCLALILPAAILALSMSRPMEEGPTIAAPQTAQDEAIADWPLRPNQDTAGLVVRGDTFLGTGDIASARLYYQQAADAGNARAAMFLGLTFDPAFLERSNVRGMRGDITQAAIWYRRARDLGEPEAVRLLAGLDSK